jgi:hypothetical protein
MQCRPIRVRGKGYWLKRRVIESRVAFQSERMRGSNVMKKQYFLQERRAAVKKFQTTIVFQALERTIRDSLVRQCTMT